MLVRQSPQRAGGQHVHLGQVHMPQRAGFGGDKAHLATQERGDASGQLGSVVTVGPDHSAVGEGDLDGGWQATVGGRGEEPRMAIQQCAESLGVFCAGQPARLDVHEAIRTVAGDPTRF